MTLTVRIQIQKEASADDFAPCRATRRPVPPAWTYTPPSTSI